MNVQYEIKGFIVYKLSCSVVVIYGRFAIFSLYQARNNDRIQMGRFTILDSLIIRMLCRYRIWQSILRGEEVSIMATSSITKNFVISGKEQVEAFADAIEAAANDKTPVPGVSARVLTDPKDIAKFMQKRKKANAAK